MIVVNIYLESGCNAREGEYVVNVAGIINEEFIIDEAPDMIDEAIKEEEELIAFIDEMGEGWYEVQLIKEYEAEGYGGWHYYRVDKYRKLPAHDFVYEEGVKGEEIRLEEDIDELFIGGDPGDLPF